MNYQQYFNGNPGTSRREETTPHLLPGNALRYGAEGPQQLNRSRGSLLPPQQQQQYPQQRYGMTGMPQYGMPGMGGNPWSRNQMGMAQRPGMQYGQQFGMQQFQQPQQNNQPWWMKYQQPQQQPAFQYGFA
jgi:hypothetical protein